MGIETGDLSREAAALTNHNEQRPNNAADKRAPAVHFGILASWAPAMLPLLTKSVALSALDVRLVVRSGDDATLRQDLARGALDAALILGRDEDLEPGGRQRLESYWLCGPAARSQVAQAVSDLPDLQHLPLVTQHYSETAFKSGARVADQLDACDRTASAEQLRASILMENGFALMPDIFVREAMLTDPRFICIDMGDRLPPRPLHFQIRQRKSSSLTPSSLLIEGLGAIFGGLTPTNAQRKATA